MVTLAFGQIVVGYGNPTYIRPVSIPADRDVTYISIKLVHSFCDS